MHIMEGECEKSGGCLTAEGAPEIGAKANGVILAEEALENGSGVQSPDNKKIDDEPPGQEEPGGTAEEPGGDGEPPQPEPEPEQGTKEPVVPEEPVDTVEEAPTPRFVII